MSASPMIPIKWIAFAAGLGLAATAFAKEKPVPMPYKPHIEQPLHTALYVLIETVLHEQQRYDTTGDWHWSTSIFPTLPPALNILVSDMPDERFVFLVALHELIEAYLCKVRGISEESVTAFDKAHLNADEPGDLPDAPYHREHVFASKIERLMADELGVDWQQYEAAIEELSK